MKTIVYDRDFEELEIKPKVAIEQYRDMTAHDVKARLVDGETLTDRGCPGCHCGAVHPAFEKSGLRYVECTECHTVYVSPCPTDEALTAFYRTSPSAQFWRQHIWAPTREVRQRKVYRPLAEWIVDAVDRHLPDARRALDVGYHSRLLLEELMVGRRAFGEIVVTNPVADIECAGLQLDGVHVQPTLLAQVASYGPFHVVTACDIVPCLADVDALFASARSSLVVGGLLLFTATSISGFDLQVLWDASPTIYPPDRITLPSVQGLLAACRRHGYEVLEFSTPGAFDVDIVKGVLQQQPQLNPSRFIRALMAESNEQTLREFQGYLQQHRLSSYARLLVRKQ